MLGHVMVATQREQLTVISSSETAWGTGEESSLSNRVDKSHTNINQSIPMT